MSLSTGYKRPVIKTATVSIAIGGTDTVTIDIPVEDRLFYVKQVNVTNGADVTVETVLFDGNDTGQSASFDTEAIFGDLLTASSSVTITGTNAAAATAAEDLTLELIGYTM